MQRVVLVDKNGAVVKEYGCTRQFGSIVRDGVRYRSLHKQGLDHVYVDEAALGPPTSGDSGGHPTSDNER